MRGHRMGLDLITGVPDVPHRHGLARGDGPCASRAIVLTGDRPRIDEGSQDQPCGPPVTQARYLPAPLAPPSPEPEPEPPVPWDDLDAVPLTHGQVRTVLTTLDIPAERKRDRAETCADCAGQSCFACESRLRDARTGDQPTRQFLDGQAARTAGRQPGPEAPPGFASGKKVGR
jgi:hypothetical protein